MAESSKADRGLAAAVSAVEAKSWLEVVGRQVEALKFGSIQITMHEGRVVQIETSVKVRFEGYPTVIVLNSEGKKVGELGYLEGGPDAFIAELEKLKGK